eukprot:CAMPEP_0177591134 /NCGR_PEP_ID=MMETSP0419_2-20121207/7821_1 /TAXON_ID=582737 /ORGANISM="Tetraselmis sp., Strain GSL018" /LENGTH=665 /DNA_ID=CAMNT_0019081827 /DNA_START=151 /DNA_END=2149 /DNA_ORIENTATION=-
MSDLLNKLPVDKLTQEEFFFRTLKIQVSGLWMSPPIFVPFVVTPFLKRVFSSSWDDSSGKRLVFPCKNLPQFSRPEYAAEACHDQLLPELGSVAAVCMGKSTLHKAFWGAFPRIALQHRRPGARGVTRRAVRLRRHVAAGLRVLGAAGVAGLGAGWYALRATLRALGEEGDTEWAAFSTWAYLRSLPHTARAISWSVRSALEYKWLAFAKKGLVSSDEYAELLAELHEERGTRLVHVLQANGGIYVKAGQLASTMSIVPAEYRELLESLQDAMPPRSASEIEVVLLKELGAHSWELFETFEPEARAAASLAQVHRATLPGGQPVAVKVQYPGLEVAVAHDMGTMRLLAAAAAWIFPDVRLGWIVDSLSSSIADEMDFTVEAAHAARLNLCLAERRRGGLAGSCSAPRVVPELSAARVMTMEWVDGCKVSDAAAMEAMGLNPEQVGELLLHVFADLTFRAGFVHGDPHPGNLLVRRRDGDRRSGAAGEAEVVLLDHGVYLELDEKLRDLYAGMWCCMLVGDMAGAVRSATALAGTRAGALLPILLQPGALSRERRRGLREESGIRGVGDAFRLVDEVVPPKLVEAIKVGAVVRIIAARLGVPRWKRQLINAYHAAHRAPRWSARWKALAAVWMLEAYHTWLLALRLAAEGLRRPFAGAAAAAGLAA